ncbi:hypothetical protein EJ04DRAFT_30985 [Polyplosphaeria fusca]|uniref:Uncharacterized protein n=1 Tax=Polyplosphaeria fusca TaxID=682080 RepID=A0A9P4UZ49_9PLEO|nr:hypothetical protein EJ04DRAFT_30985 [Polyplosphaeria fusca]
MLSALRTHALLTPPLTHPRCQLPLPPFLHLLFYQLRAHSQSTMISIVSTRDTEDGLLSQEAQCVCAKSKFRLGVSCRSSRDPATTHNPSPPPARSPSRHQPRP